MWATVCGSVAKGCRLDLKPMVSYAFRMAARSSPSASADTALAKNILRHTLDCYMCQTAIAAHERELQLLATEIENANLRVNKT